MKKIHALGILLSFFALTTGCKQAAIDRCIETTEFTTLCVQEAAGGEDTLDDDTLDDITEGCEESVDESIESGCKSECGDANKCTNSAATDSDASCDDVFSGELFADCADEIEACQECLAEAEEE